MNVAEGSLQLTKPSAVGTMQLCALRGSGIMTPATGRARAGKAGMSFGVTGV